MIVKTKSRVITLATDLVFFVVTTHYPSGRTSANICSCSGYAFLIKTGTRHITYRDELSFVLRLERRTTKDSSSGRIMRLVPFFILETRLYYLDGWAIFFCRSGDHPVLVKHINLSIKYCNEWFAVITSARTNKCFAINRAVLN